MVDTPPDEFPETPAANPPAAEERQALSAIDAAASQDNVVAVKFGGAKSADVSAAPPPQDSAVAPTKGKGAAPERKKEKTIDWGKLNSLLDNFALIYGTDTVWDGNERIIMKIANMGHAHGSDMVRMWKTSERRRTVRQEDVVFDPTQTCAPECINLFNGMPMTPAKGDVAPVLDLIKFLTSRTSDDADDRDAIMHWLISWLAYPLQHPGAKLKTAIVMHGDEGAGKNFLFDMIVAIYGKYGTLVGQDELEDKFNDWRSCKLFVVGDEVSSRAELVHNKNRLKALITSLTVQINPKNLPRREEANHMNIVFLSNELQPLALDNSDRRMLVVYTPPKRDFEYYKSLAQWRDHGGLAAFYEFLLAYPLDDFDPNAPAPFTQAKDDLISINRKSPERFWLEWSGGELDLPYSSGSAAQVYQAYLKYAQRVGDRFPVQREVFTPMVRRFSESQGKPVTIKVMKLESAGAKKAERMFLVTEPVFAMVEQGGQLVQQKQGVWATETVDSFADHLKVYLGWSPSPRGNDDGAEGAKA